MQGRVVQLLVGQLKAAFQEPNLLQTLSNRLFGKQLILHSGDERLRNLFPVVRQQRRVRDRNAKRVTEQGADCEPVGQTADNAGFEASLQEGAPYGIGYRYRGQKSRTHNAK
ncbi:hypothetical protein D3C85_1259640 [compost metagenome]